jgi:protein TonB
MFETVAPEVYYRPNRKALYEALPFSIAVHAIAGLSVLVGSVWTIEFPSQSPSQIASFAIAEPPPPPPPPPPPAAPKAQPAQTAVVQRLADIVAPTIIPDEIPEVSSLPIVAEAPPEAIPDGVEGGVPGGVIGGVIDGVAGGEVGGTKDGVLGGVVIDRVVVERDKPLGMFPLSQTFPGYPEDARVRSWEDEIVVRYVIGKDGRVKDVSVVKPPQRDLFVQGTVRAIRSWRFRPLMKNGQRQEVVHELTVFYKLNV